MTIQPVYRFFLFCSLLALGVSCTAGPTPIEPAAVSPAAAFSTPTALSPTPTIAPTQSPAAAQPTGRPPRTRQPRKTQAPQTFPTSAYTPVNERFNIILGRPTATSITASLYSKFNVQVELNYTSDASTAGTGPIQLKAGVPQNIELSGLKPDTLYTYQAIVDGVPSERYHFHTQRPPGSYFVFTIDADPHNRDPRFNGELYAVTLNNALYSGPDFHINLGDTFVTEKIQARSYAEAESTFMDLRPYFGLIGASAPLFLVNGNHEGELGWLLARGGQDNLALWSTQLRRLYYPNPLPGAFYSGATAAEAALGSPRDGYYAWTWGDALFVALDPFWYTTEKPQADDLDSNWNWTLGKAQYDWLKATLENSDAKFKFIFFHHLVGGAKDGRGGVEFAGYFEWGGNNADGSYGFDQHRPGWDKPIHQLLVENRVSAVFHGHDHVFVRQELDGVVYQECPQPSNTDYNSARLAGEYGYVNGDAVSSSGHLRITVTPKNVTVEYVRAYLPGDENPDRQNGQVDYRYTIQLWQP